MRKKFLILCCALLCCGLLPARAATYTVTTTADPGAGGCTAAGNGDGCTLREAIAAANGVAGNDTVVFAAGVTGAIILSAALPSIEDNLALTGPGAGDLTVARSSAGGTGNFGIFVVTADKTVSLSGLTLTNGSGVGPFRDGGCIYNSGTINLNNCVLSDNNAEAESGLGGAVYNNAGRVNVSACTFSGNAASQGGAFYTNNGTVIIDDSTFSGNAATSVGGGFRNSTGATVTITNSTFSGNSARISGGGIYSDWTLTVKNCTLTANRADSDGNASGDGGGLAVPQGTSAVRNTIIAGNFRGSGNAADDISGSVGSAGYNLVGNALTAGGMTDGSNGNIVGDGGSGTLATGAILNTSLTNNGGPTSTHAPIFNGPAYNAGDPAFASPPAFDQRGALFPRVQGGRIDIGAVELSATNVRVRDTSVTEGDTGTVTMTFKVELTSAFSNTVTVDYATANGSATAGVDYQSRSGSLTFLPGETAKTVTVPVNGDTLAEANETVLVNLSNAVEANIINGQAVGRIMDDDASPTLSISDAPAAAEGNAGSKIRSFIVTMSKVSGRVVTVEYITGGGTAAADDDYAAQIGILTFARGQTSKTIKVAVNGDVLDEDDETFEVNLFSATGAVIENSKGTTTILDDDAAPRIGIQDASIVEGNPVQDGPATVDMNFTLTLSAPSGKVVAVFASTGTAAGPQATPGTDYSVLPESQFFFQPGETTTVITVPVKVDTLNEKNEVFAVNLSNPANGTISDNQAIGTINDDDAPPAITINNVSLTEGNSGSKLMTFTLTLSAASGRSVTVNYATSDEPGTIAGEDYVAKSGSVTFGVGQTTKTVAVTIKGDVLNEGDERLFLDLTGPVNATIERSRGVGTIVNDDPLPHISIDDVSVFEGDSGSKAMTFTIQLSTPTTRSVTVNYTTSDLSAVAGSDYVAKSGSVTIGVRQIGKTIVIPILGDIVLESDETLRVTLSNAVNATISRARGTGTIVNDDVSG